MNDIRIQAPDGTSELSHGGVPYLLDEERCATVPEDVAPHFLRLPGFRLAPEPQPKATPTRRQAATKED